jgi:hypothetical protein
MYVHGLGVYAAAHELRMVAFELVSFRGTVIADPTGNHLRSTVVRHSPRGRQ